MKRKELTTTHKATKAQSFGRACLEGNFELIETATGDTLSSTDLLGKWVLIYFGFTRCPDICPEQLEKLAYAIEGVQEAKNVTQMSMTLKHYLYQLIVNEIVLMKSMNIVNNFIQS